jgi:hypothetical protein
MNPKKILWKGRIPLGDNPVLKLRATSLGASLTNRRMGFQMSSKLQRKVWPSNLKWLLKDSILSSKRASSCVSSVRHLVEKLVSCDPLMETWSRCQAKMSRILEEVKQLKQKLNLLSSSLVTLRSQLTHCWHLLFREVLSRTVNKLPGFAIRPSETTFSLDSLWMKLATARPSSLVAYRKILRTKSLVTSLR